VPDKQHNKRADDRSDQPRALIDSVPADRLPNKCGNECPGDAKQRGQNKTSWIVGAGREQPGDNAGQKPDDEDPEDVHGYPLNCLAVAAVNARSGNSIGS
jgi:hypothetical protein